MKKTAIATILALTLCLGSQAALAENANTSSGSLTGELVTSEETSVRAPYSGRVEDFNLRVGDMVESGEMLFSLETTKVYAPCDGEVVMAAVESDNADYRTTQYGALAYIAPENEFIVKTDSSDAYDSYKNKYVHLGEEVYLESSSDTDRNGTGIIVAVDGDEYTVEVLESNLRFDEKCSIHRDSDYTESSRLGRGYVKRNAPVAVEGSGYVLRSYVADGDNIGQGTLMFELVDSVTAVQEPEDVVSTDENAVIASIKVGVGDTVSENQVLATLYPAGTLEAAIELTEYDLSDVAVNDQLEITLDCDSSRVYRGTVSSISNLPQSSGDDTTYIAYVTFENDDFVRTGMNVTAQLVD